jgi:hypothetical protein
MLLIDDDDELSAAPDAEEAELASTLGPAGLASIDDTLCRLASPRWQKLAKVIANAMQEGGCDPGNQVAVRLHTRRVCGLVDARALRAQGNPRKPRWSEVCLP